MYTFGYSIGFGPAAWVYGSEVHLSSFVGGSDQSINDKVDLSDEFQG